MSQDNSADEFLNLISNPFQSQVQVNSIYASIIWSFLVSGGLFALFVLLRPRISTVYAPRAKHADQKHSPPSLDRTLFAWTTTMTRIQEQELGEKIGLDAIVFLRFVRMLRDIFLILVLIGCGMLIPINLAGGHGLYSHWSNVATLMKFTPQYIFGQKFWAYVALAYMIQAVLFFFIWWNYRAVLRLRRAYFDSHDYRSSLHSRTLLVTHLPKSSRTDAGLSQIMEEAKPTEDVPRTAIAHNVKDLPKMFEEHERAVGKLESVLAKYLANPHKLPEKRPTCKVAKEDRNEYGNQPVDAIGYLTGRIRKLELIIQEVRKTVDQRDSMPYGFASYTHIEDAHAVAYAARKKAPQHSQIRLAPKPTDLIWQNLPMSRATRRTRFFWDSLWMILLTVAYIPLNILSAVFLSDFSHLGIIWPSFNKNLHANPVGWGIAQGILAPTFQFLIFLALPTVFRRLYNHAGDVSKTSRERHVAARLYAFFVFNNLVVFSVFGSGFRFLAAVLQAKDQSIWHAIRNAHLFTNVMTGLCNVSTFWLTYQMQQNLSAAIDISQLWPLAVGWLQRKFTHPTPRQLIEISAPPPMDYASYYNNYLFVATIGLCFGILQPIIFPITAFYLVIELCFKRYLLQYVLITKVESGGVFWRTLVNRLLFSNLLCNAVIALIVGAQGIGAHDLIEDTAANAGMLYAMIPLPFFVWAFKWFCSRTFDDKMRYSTTSSVSDLETAGDGVSKPRGTDRVGVRFGNPVLYKKLIRPMVDAKSQHLLKELMSEDFQQGSTEAAMFGYSDMYMSEMEHRQPGKPSLGGAQPFEFVQEGDMDFENFKKREEFGNEHGGDGELYGKPDDLISRPGTPSTAQTLAALDEGKEVSRSGAITRESSQTRRDTLDEIERSTAQGGGSSPFMAPQTSAWGAGRDRSASVDVDIPDAGMDVGEIMRVGSREPLRQEWI